MTNWLWIGSSTILCLQWLVIHFTGGHPPPHWMALSSGFAIFGAAFMLSWAAELAQKDIPQALAIALLALIAVLPEYAVDMYFAWQAGKDPKYTAFAMANMTGANRLLIGVGWAAVVMTFWLKSGKKAIQLEPEHKTEIFYLGIGDNLFFHHSVQRAARSYRRGCIHRDFCLLHACRVEGFTYRTRARRSTGNDRTSLRRGDASLRHPAIFSVLRVYHFYRR